MRKLLTILLSIPSFCIAQSVAENYIKQTSYKQEFKGDYLNFNQSISTPDIIYSDMGGGSGNLIINNNLLTFNFSGSWSVNYARLKQGVIKDMAISPNIPYLDLGPILQIGTSIETGYNAKIENNKLIFYSPYFLKDFLINLTQPILGGSPNYSVSIPNLYTCPSGGSGGASGSVTISGGNINLNASAGWSDLCNLRIGQMVYLATSTIPNMDLGVIKTSLGFDSAYRAKIENNWLVFYSPTPIPALPSSGSLSFSVNFNPLTLTSVTYFDGLGRPKQSIAHQQSATGKDIVTHIEYDASGRQAKEYLPYVPTTAASLDYKSTALTNLASYYNTPYYENTSNPFSQKQFESSPLNRVLEQAAPGNDWSLTNSIKHTVQFDYQTNTVADQVRYFSVSFISGNTENPYLEDNGIYNPNQLYKTITKNENWSTSQGYYTKDNTTEEFKDKEGRVVLKRSFDSSKWYDTYYVYDDYGNLTYVLPPKVMTYHSITQNHDGQYTERDAIEIFENATTYEVWFSQYKAWDDTLVSYLNCYGFNPGSILISGFIDTLDFSPQLPNMTLGNIMAEDINGNAVIAGVATIVNGSLYFNSTGVGVYNFLYLEATTDLLSYQASFTPLALNRNTFDDLIYQYKYDKRNRLIEKKLPGKNWEYIVYDKLDRPILTQDANLKLTDKWLFTKYDVFSRPVYTGEYVNSTSGQTTRSAVQALADASSILFETKQAANTINGTTVYYSNSAFPNATNINLFTINYYDDYNFDLNGGSTELTYGITSITNVKGLTTGSKVRILDTSNWITNVSYYDAKSRPIYNYTKNDYLATTSKVKSKLNFIGETLETTSTHLKNSITTSVVDAFTYDQTGRLIKQTQAINGANQPEVIVANTYNELGQLISKKIGGKTSNGLQKVDYAYNIRGWLKSINDYNNLDQDNDLFGFGLNYNTITNSSLPTYYQNKPLYNGNISNTSWKTNYLDSSLKEYNYTYDALNRFKSAYYIENNSFNYKFDEGVNSYDRNGNIMILYRSMQSPTDANSAIGIDYLNYNYDSGNKLLSVKDSYGLSGNGPEGFKDGNSTGNDYTYDANGNMKKDLNKGIGTTATDEIIYNHLNLPTKITFATGTIDYVYDATGVKQRKIITPGVTTDYAGGFQYENNQLKFFPQPEGYVVYNAGNFSYVYQYKDHLGNIRLSFGDSDNNGQITPPLTYQSVWEDGFESASGWDSLNAIYGSTVTAYDTSRKRSGNISAKIEKLTFGEQYVHSNTWININNTQATDYIYSAWVYSNGPSADIFLFMKTSTETGYFTNLSTIFSYNTGRWIYLEKRVTVPANITKLNLRIDNNGGGTVWFDDVKIRKVTTNSLNEIVEENNYYPFGSKHKDSNNVVTSTNPGQKYKFQNKEWQDELSLNLYDFDARNYDPAIVRTLTQDPLSEKFYSMSPYSFLNNNPLRFIDPTGMEGTDWIQRGNEFFYDPTIKTQEQATAVYGSDANHLNDGSRIVAKDGSYEYNLNNSNGKVTDCNGATVDTSQNVTTPGGSTIISPDSKTGSYMGIGVGGSVGGGISFELGIVKDATGNYGAYFSFGGNVGLSADAGIKMGEATPTGSNPFAVTDFAGQSNSFNGGLGPFSGEVGGSDGSKQAGVDRINPASWGTNPRGYQFNNAGPSVIAPSIIPSVSVGAQYTGSKTWVWDF